MDANTKEHMDHEQWMGHIADLQAAHSSHITSMVYGQGLQEQAGTTAHQPPVYIREAELATMDLEAATQHITGRPNMQFWGVQDPAMQAIQQGESPVVAVMPMGGGKSMLFMVPAFAAPGGTTIIMVPLVALQADMMWRCQELSISCIAWESQRPPDAASIILVTPESAARTQMVWLTATLPLSMEDELCQQIKHNQATITIYRAQTSRPNVAYWVWRPLIPGVGRGLYQWIKTGGKVIIYANIIGQVTAMARVLGCEVYYSEQLDKAGVLVWFMGASPVIAATSALGMGVDIPNIRSIIHIGTPWTLLDYA
ncbi:hypothetical protein CNMCM8686_003244 [Aspergillus fumigatus]|nr:hypothetical protein CNMCM8686_003244 [Aspergillus fumigatus]